MTACPESRRRVRITVWSDYVCPFCYLEEPAAENEHTQKRYKFPYGDFKKVHRCAVLSAESRGRTIQYADIENAAAHLYGMIDAQTKKSQRASRAQN